MQPRSALLFAAFAVRGSHFERGRDDIQDNVLVQFHNEMDQIPSRANDLHRKTFQGSDRHILPYYPLVVNRSLVPTSSQTASGLAAPRVELLMDLAQVSVGDVGVDLRGVDARVAEELLYRADVGAIA